MVALAINKIKLKTRHAKTIICHVRVQTTHIQLRNIFRVSRYHYSIRFIHLYSVFTKPIRAKCILVCEEVVDDVNLSKNSRVPLYV